MKTPATFTRQWKKQHILKPLLPVCYSELLFNPGESVCLLRWLRFDNSDQAGPVTFTDVDKVVVTIRLTIEKHTMVTMDEEIETDTSCDKWSFAETEQIECMCWVFSRAPYVRRTSSHI